MGWPAQILIIARESSAREQLEKLFRAAGVSIFSCATLLEVQSFLSGQTVNAVFSETALPDGDFRAVQAVVCRLQSGVPIVALTRKVDWDTYLSGMGAGAFDCLNLPPSPVEAKHVLWSALHAFSTADHREAVEA